MTQSQKCVVRAAILALTLTCAHASSTPEAAQELARRHDVLVLPMLNEDNEQETTLVTQQLEKLAKKAKLVKAAKAATNAPDTAFDTCLLEENSTLHAWKVCNATRFDQTTQMHSDCNARDDAGVAFYTIDESQSFGFSYKPSGAAVPRATCNFETYTLEGTDASCDAFIDDIVVEAKEEFDAAYSTFTDAANRCQMSIEILGNTTIDCVGKGVAHRAKEEECVRKGTDRQSKLCKLHMALKAKCTTLKMFTKAVDDLADQEEIRNKEIRTVSYSKCLLTRYSEHGETCFKTSVAEHCAKMVNGASEEYATTSAEQIHGFRTDGKTHIQEFPCEAESITIGVNDLSYEKLDPADEFSYYAQRGPLTLSTSVSLSPTVSVQVSPVVCPTPQ